MLERPSRTFSLEVHFPMQMNEGTADKVISQDQMSRPAQTYLRTDENLRIREFSIDIQQAEGQHINNLEEI